MMDVIWNLEDGKIAKDEIDTWIIDAAGQKQQEKGMDKVTLTRMRGG
jgi:hypothetical protein